MKTIFSKGLYPCPVDGTASVSRRHGPNYPLLGDPWPEIGPGETIKIDDDAGWSWVAEVVSVKGEGDSRTARVRPIEEKRQQPFPKVEEGWIKLPSYSHAHARSWDRGSIVEIHGKHYKVEGRKESRTRNEVLYRLEPATKKQYDTRPMRIAVQPGSPGVGAAIQTDDGWLHIKKLTRTHFHGAAGRGDIIWAEGRRVSAEKAEEINALHPGLLSQALNRDAGERVRGAMPPEAVQLLPENPHMLVATGERLALVGKEVLHERVGDPDRLDSTYRYIVKITDPALKKRATAFVKKASKAKKTAR